MIHDELGRAWVVGDEGPEGVDVRTPLDFLLSAETDLGRDEAVTVGIEAVRALHTWVCDQGPHPRRIVERLVKATLHYAPALVAAVEGGEVAAVLGGVAARETALMRLLLDNRRASARAVAFHSARIDGVLGKAFRRERHTFVMGRPATRLEVLTVEDELATGEEAELRREAVQRWLRHIWKARQLAEALKAFYALTRSFWPELVLNMSGEEISTFFVQTRAAESERVHRLVNRPVERHTGRHTTLRFQKSTAACGVYSRAQQGNHHRADSVKRAA